LVACTPATRTAAPGSQVPRIVSLSPAATETLFAVGCGGGLVLRDAWSDFPPEVKQLPAVAGFAPSAEAILAVRPTLVVAHYPPPGLKLALERAGVTVQGFAPVTLDEVGRSFADVAAACGQAERGQALQAEFAARVAALAARVDASTARKPKPRLYYEMDAGDAGRPFTVGRGSFGHALIEAAGAINVFADAGATWFQVSAESVLAADPDVIVLADADSIDAPQSAALVAARPGWSTVRAVRLGRIVTVPADLTVRPGPRLAAGLERLARALHPDLAGAAE
jgi:iron complex transport system substrate-binding protein